MRPPTKPSAVLVLLALVVLALAVLLVGGCAASPDAGGGPSTGGAAASPTALSGAASFPASDVLRAWDRDRSRAFARGDVEALRGLYVEGSTAGTSDARLLRAYLRRGLRVEGMRMQVLALEVLREDTRRLMLRVTDRLAGGVAVGHGQRIRLPRDRASTRVIDLRLWDGRWQVASVRESGLRRAAR